jgi:hypothetical protein
MTASDRWVRLAALIAAIGWQVSFIVVLIGLPRRGSFVEAQFLGHEAALLSQAEAVTDVAIWRPSRAELSGSKSPPLSHRTVLGPKLRAIHLDLPDLPVDHLEEITAVQGIAEPAASGIVPIRCEVHIHQRGDGQVQAIDFGSCNGDAVWQQQVLRNFQRAAELVTLHADRSAATVRTLTLDTSAVAPEIIAAQLSEP